jgi:probable rRNA maturation factor
VRRAPATPAVTVELNRRVRAWVPSRRELSTWAAAALGRRGRGQGLAVAVVGAPESRQLNARFRGRDRPTNVLSFPPASRPVPGGHQLGDLVICPRVLRAEAAAQEKPLRAHWAHLVVHGNLVVHGTLHLIGYDHERAADAKRMERREVTILRGLGFANPYRDH